VDRGQCLITSKEIGVFFNRRSKEENSVKRQGVFRMEKSFGTLSVPDTNFSNFPFSSDGTDDLWVTRPTRYQLRHDAADQALVVD